MKKQRPQISIQQATRAKVMQLLQISELEYAAHQMETGLAYLSEQLDGSVMESELAKCPLFWAWWRNHWHHQDMEFVELARDMSHTERHIYYYEISHALADFQFKPPRPILLETFKALHHKQVIKHQL